jgi:hypothetical protein
MVNCGLGNVCNQQISRSAVTGTSGGYLSANLQSSSDIAGYSRDRLASKPPTDRVARNLWLAIWIVLMFVPTVPVGFTETLSRFSLASPLAAICVLWRVLCRPLPSFRHGSFSLGALFGIYLCIHGASLAAYTGKFAIIFLEGQIAVIFLAALLLAYDICAESGGAVWLCSWMVRLAAIAAVCGLISVWTGPFYDYGTQEPWIGARWGLPIDRAAGTMGVPSVLAVPLELAFLVEFFGAQSKFSRRKKIVLVLLMTTLILTQSKGGILSCLLAIAAGMPFVAANRTRMKVAVFMACSFFLIVGAITWVAATYEIDFKELIATDVEGRGQLASETLSDYFVDDTPQQLFGIGWRQSATIGPEGLWFTAHNSYIVLLRELGLFGTLLYCGFVLTTAARLRTPVYRKYIFALLALLMFGNSDVIVLSYVPLVFQGSLGGLVCALNENKAKRFARFGRPSLLSSQQSGLQPL